MNIAVMQPYFFPYLGFFQLLRAVDVFVILDDVNFIKRGYIHRNLIDMHGTATRLTLRIAAVSQNARICDLSVLPGQGARLGETVRHAYRRAPFFGEGSATFNKAIDCGETQLHRYLAHGLREVAETLGIKTSLIFASQLSIKQGVRGQARILDICRQVGADTYINPIGGLNLYDAPGFATRGVRLRFLKMHAVPGAPSGSGSAPFFSIIDSIMKRGVQATSELLGHRDLIDG